MTRQRPADVPASLAARPHDSRRGLPIPAVNEFPELPEGHDFTVINGARGIALAAKRWCALCAQPMGSAVAFLGGPRAAQAGNYTDPPGHPDCIRAATRLCPHIAIPHARRAKSPRTTVPSTDIAGYDYGKPDIWVMFVAQGFSIGLEATGDGGHVPIYLPIGCQYTVVFRYDSGRLVAEKPVPARSTYRP